MALGSHHAPGSRPLRGEIANIGCSESRGGRGASPPLWSLHDTGRGWPHPGCSRLVRRCGAPERASPGAGCWWRASSWFRRQSAWSPATAITGRSRRSTYFGTASWRSSYIQMPRGKARSRVVERLCELRVHHRTAEACGRAWIRNADFLLSDASGPGESGYTHVVGNPPYVRWSKIPAVLKVAYERYLPRELTRGDLFLPFLDRALDALQTDGRCGLLCSDRWRYTMSARNFRQKWLPLLDIVSNDPIDATAAFTRSVYTYPTILIASKRSTPRQERPPTVAKRTGRTLKELGCTIKVGPALGTDACLRASTRRRWGRGGTPYSVGGQFGDTRRCCSLGRPPYRRNVRRHRTPNRSGPVSQLGATSRSVCACVEETLHRPKWCSLVSDHRPGASLGLVPAEAARAGACQGPQGLPSTAPAPSLRMASTRYSFATTGIEAIYDKLRDGRLARALDGIAPKVKGGYVRCYRRFLSMIRV